MLMPNHQRRLHADFTSENKPATFFLYLSLCYLFDCLDCTIWKENFYSQRNIILYEISKGGGTLSSLRYRECLRGARNVLKDCLAIRPGERILVVVPAYDTNTETIVSAGSSVWWTGAVCSSEGPGCDSALNQTLVDRIDLQLALMAAATELGSVVTPFAIDTTSVLDATFNWRDGKKAAHLLKFLKDWNVIIDMTLFGLDEMPATRKSRKITNLREEVLDGSQVRGADMHVISRRSFVDGAACADYRSLEKEITAFKNKFEGVEYLTIKGSGTDLRLNLDKGSASCGTGLVHKPGEWHFLPSGVIFMRVKKAGNFGRIRLDGPMYGVGSLKDYPLSLELLPRSGIVGRYTLSDTTPRYIQKLINDMFNIPESRCIGELVIGFNPNGSIDSVAPMEFYVARGGVSIAFGRNDQIGGEIRPTSELSPSIHAHALLRNSTVILDNGTVVIKDGKLLD